MTYYTLARLNGQKIRIQKVTIPMLFGAMPQQNSPLFTKMDNAIRYLETLTRI